MVDSVQTLEKQSVRTVQPTKSDLERAKILSHKWSAILTSIRIYRDLMRSCQFHTVKEVIALKRILEKLEQKNFDYASKAFKLLHLDSSDKAQKDLIDLKAVQFPPYLIATVKVKKVEFETVAPPVSPSDSTVRVRVPSPDTTDTAERIRRPLQAKKKVQKGGGLKQRKDVSGIGEIDLDGF